jgi:hypothetical protein
VTDPPTVSLVPRVGAVGLEMSEMAAAAYVERDASAADRPRPGTTGSTICTSGRTPRRYRQLPASA